MKRYIFNGKRTDLHGGYACSEPGDNSGEYFLCSDAQARIEALKDALLRIAAKKGRTPLAQWMRQQAVDAFAADSAKEENDE